MEGVLNMNCSSLGWRKANEQEIKTRKQYKALICRGKQLLTKGIKVEIIERESNRWLKKNKVGIITQVTDSAIWVKFGGYINSYTWADIFTKTIKIRLKKENRAYAS